MNQEEYQNNIIAIAEHQCYDAQSRQLIEEMAELTQAINKAWRKRYDDRSPVTLHEEGSVNHRLLRGWKDVILRECGQPPDAGQSKGMCSP